MPAAHLALEDVNNKKDLLPGFQLTLHSNDSEVSFDSKYSSREYIKAKSEQCATSGPSKS